MLSSERFVPSAQYVSPVAHSMPITATMSPAPAESMSSFWSAWTRRIRLIRAFFRCRVL